jgi:RNA-directed DNA polymerase
LLLNSRAAKLLAVRKVTQDNHGKKTAGIDGVKSLTPSQRLTLSQNLKLDGKARPVRRVWIPKPGQPDEQRALGIPVMKERALQRLVQSALEPEWEARLCAVSSAIRRATNVVKSLGVFCTHRA